MKSISKTIRLLVILMLPLYFIISSAQAEINPNSVSEDIKSDLMKLRHAGYLINYCKDSAVSNKKRDKFLNLYINKGVAEKLLIEKFNNENLDNYTFDYRPDLHPNFNKTIAAFVNDQGGCTNKLIKTITRDIDKISRKHKLSLSTATINEYDQPEIKEFIQKTHSVSCRVIGTEVFKLAMMRQEGLSRAKIYEEGFKNYENLVSEALDIILRETKDIFPDKFWNESKLDLFRDILVPREDLQKTGYPDYLDAAVDAVFSRPKFPLKTWQEQEAQQTKESFISECINLTFPMEFVKQLSELITTP